MLNNVSATEFGQHLQFKLGKTSVKSACCGGCSSSPVIESGIYQSPYIPASGDADTHSQRINKIRWNAEYTESHRVFN